MRPANKDEAPFIAYDYSEYREELIARLGRFCSYCETRLNDLVPIEHLLPQKKYPDHAADWDNLLLACHSCNSSKSDKDPLGRDYVFPDDTNTWLHIKYDKETGEMVPLTVEGEATLQLVGLDGPRSEARTERRLGEAQAIIDKLEDTLTRNQADLTSKYYTSLTSTAELVGHLTIWLALYYSALPSEEHLRALLAAFPGTTREHFEQARHILTP